MTFTEYLNKNCKTYKMKITSMELGFLHSVLSRYIEDENNKDRGIDIANMIKEKVDEIVTEIYKKGR